MDDLRAMQSDAYYAIVKTMAVRDWTMSGMERETVNNVLRRELGISQDLHYELFTKAHADSTVARIKAAVDSGQVTAPGVKRPRPEVSGKPGAAPGPKRPAVSKQAGAAGKAKGGMPVPNGASTLAVANEYIGRKIKQFWPEEGGWYEAVITDYNMLTDEHCLVFDIGTSNESFIWQKLSALKKDEFSWVPGAVVPVTQIVPPGAQRPHVGGPSRGGQGRKAASGAAPLPGGARDLETQLSKAKDLSKVVEIDNEVEARMAELRAKLAKLEEEGGQEPVAAAPAEVTPVMQHAPVVEAADGAAPTAGEAAPGREGPDTSMSD